MWWADLVQKKGLGVALCDWRESRMAVSYSVWSGSCSGGVVFSVVGHFELRLWPDSGPSALWLHSEKLGEAFVR